jgi:hypothetical protein
MTRSNRDELINDLVPSRLLKKPGNGPKRHTGRDEVEIRYPVNYCFFWIPNIRLGGFRNDESRLESRSHSIGDVKGIWIISLPYALPVLSLSKDALCPTLQMLRRPQGCLESIRNFDLFEDVIQVRLHSMGADAKFLSNLIVGGSHRYLGQYLCLPPGEDLTAAS